MRVALQHDVQALAPPWWPGCPEQVARLLEAQLKAAGIEVSILGTVEPLAGERYDLLVDLRAAPGSPSDAIPRVVVQHHPQPVALDDAGVWHECWWPSRALELGVDRCYLAACPVPDLAGLPLAPGGGPFVCLEEWRPGPCADELLHVAAQAPGWPFLFLSPRAAPPGIPANVLWHRCASFAELVGLIGRASACLSFFHDDGGTGNLQAPLIAPLLGVPVVAQGIAPGDHPSAVVEDGFTGFVLSAMADVRPYLAHALHLDRGAVRERATARTAALGGAQARLRAWVAIWS